MVSNHNPALTYQISFDGTTWEALRLTLVDNRFGFTVTVDASKRHQSFYVRTTGSDAVSAFSFTTRNNLTESTNFDVAPPPGDADVARVVVVPGANGANDTIRMTEFKANVTYGGPHRHR